MDNLLSMECLNTTEIYDLYNVRALLKMVTRSQDVLKINLLLIYSLKIPHVQKVVF